MSVSTPSLSRLRPEGTPREWTVTALKFTISTFAFTALYGFLLMYPYEGAEGFISLYDYAKATVFGPKQMDPEVAKGVLQLFGMVVGSTVPAAYAYLHLPDRTEDPFHLLGKAFAVLFPINLTMTVVFLYLMFIAWPNPPEFDIVNVILYSCIASVGLPPAYVGSLIAARWSR